MTDWTLKHFRVTMTGLGWNGTTRTDTVEVTTHGDAEQAKYVVVKDHFPPQMRKVEVWDIERVR